MAQRQSECQSKSTDNEDIGADESVSRKYNHVSMLQRNERQFYDNLLASTSYRHVKHYSV